MEPTTLAR